MNENSLKTGPRNKTRVALGLCAMEKSKVRPVAHQRYRATTCRPASSPFCVRGLVTLLARLSFCVLVCLAPMVQQPPHLSVCLCHLHVHCTREEDIVFYFVLYIAIPKKCFICFISHPFREPIALMYSTR